MTIYPLISLILLTVLTPSPEAKLRHTRHIRVALSEICLGLSQGENLYLPRAHAHNIDSTPMPGGGRDRKKAQANSKSPYFTRSKTAPMEATPGEAHDTLPERVPPPFMVMADSSATPMDAEAMCSCTSDGCHLNHEVLEILASPGANAPLAHGSNPNPWPSTERQGLSDVQHLGPAPATPAESQADKVAAMYAKLINMGVADVNAGKTEDEVVAAITSAQIPPPAPSGGGGSALGNAASSFAGAAIGSAVGGLAKPSFSLNLPDLSINPSLGGLNLRPEVNMSNLFNRGSKRPSDDDVPATKYPAPLSPPQPVVTSEVAMDISASSSEDDEDTSAMAAQPPSPPPVQPPAIPAPVQPVPVPIAPAMPDDLPAETVVITPRERQFGRGLPSRRGHPPAHIGDHSIEGSDLYPKLLFTEAALNPTPANFIRVMWTRIRDADDHFEFANQSVQIRGYVHPSAVGGGLDPPVALTARVMRYHAAPIPQNERRTLDITWGEGFIAEALPLSDIMKFFVGGTISERAVSSAILPKLQPINHNTTRNLANYLIESSDSINNFGMYAKLLWSALVRDQYTFAGVQPAAVAFGADFPIQFINLDDANLNYTLISTAILRGDIILVDRVDYDAHDLQAAHYLAKPGRRYESPAAAATPHTNYVRWPGLQVTVLHHGAAPAVPQAEALSAEAIFSFALKLAHQRNELKHLVEGLYWVFDHCGIRYTLDAAHPNAQYVLPDFRITDVKVPRPQDYNVLLRLAGVRPTSIAEDGAEITQYTTIRSTDRIRLAALYTASYSTFLTTVLHSIQIAGDRVREWYAGAALAPSAVQLITYLNTITTPVPQGAEAPIYNMIKDCFPKFMSVDVARHTNRGSQWLGSFGSRPLHAAAYAGLPTLATMRLFNPLIIDNFINVRPREWGIVGPRPKANFLAEIVIQAPAAQQGWRSLLGSKIYSQTASSPTPFGYVEYGAYALNVITQYLRPAQQEVSYQDAYYVPNGHPEFNNPQVAQGPEYLEAIHSFIPCTIMTWDANDTTVRAVAIIGNQIPNHDLVGLRNLQGQVIEAAGLGLTTLNTTHGAYQFPPMMQLPPMLGGPPPVAEPERPVTPPPPAALN